MKTEDINVISTHISLFVGDNIIGSTGTQYKVVDIDYNTGMLTIRVNFSDYNITFDAIAIGDYKKVLEDTNIIKTTNGDISIKTGDAIINNGRLLKVTTVAYDSGLVDINENGDEYTISLADIHAVDYIDSVTQIVTTNPRKNRLIIIANGLNSHSSIKEVKDDYVALANNSPRVGDSIVDSDGNKYKVGLVDYDNLFIVAISKDDEQHTINFDEFSSGEYSKATNSSVKEGEDNNSPKIGDEITGAEGNKYKVVCIDYNNCEVIVRSTDGEEFGFNIDGLESSVYKKVLK